MLVPVLSLPVRDGHASALQLKLVYMFGNLLKRKLKTGWSADGIHLAKITLSQPLAVYSTFTRRVCPVNGSTINGERFAGLNFRIFYSFQEYHENFSVSISASL